MPVTRAALDTASRAALRAILAVRPDANAVEYPSFIPEQSGASDPPLLSSAELLEDMAARRVAPSRGAGFTAFLDGTQRAQILAWVDGVPFLFGTAGAVIRTRHDRRLRTWREPLIEQRAYLPLAYARDFNRSLEALSVVDTTARDLGPIPSRHPAALLERAFTCLQRDRELVEQRLASAWVEAADGVLCADGALPGGAAIRESSLLIGVVKSHRTLYAEGGFLDLVLSLTPGERSPAFRVAVSGRTPVASWYLRTRDARGRDALWGLVRIEAALDRLDAARANLISGWVLAEGAPLALPDPRWDKMSYGIQNCEAFLRAVS